MPVLQTGKVVIVGCAYHHYVALQGYPRADVYVPLGPIKTILIEIHTLPRCSYHQPLAVRGHMLTEEISKETAGAGYGVTHQSRTGKKPRFAR